MIKKLVLGIAICYGISGANGMEDRITNEECESTHTNRVDSSQFFRRFGCFTGSLSSRDYSNWEPFFKDMEAAVEGWYSYDALYYAISNLFEYGVNKIVKFNNEKLLNESNITAIRKLLTIIPGVIKDMPCFSDEESWYYNGMTIDKKESILREFSDIDTGNTDLIELLTHETFQKAAAYIAARQFYLLHQANIY